MSIPETHDQATFELKGDKVRWNILASDPSAGYRVYDGAARRLFTVDPNVPSVLASDVAPLSDESPPVGRGTSGSQPWSVSFQPAQAADTSAIAGHPCSRFVATSGAVVFQGCAARDMARIPLEYVFPNATESLPFLGTLAAQGGLPLSAQRTGLGARGEEEAEPALLTMQVRPMRIDSARFAVPNYPVTNAKLAAPRKLPR